MLLCSDGQIDLPCSLPCSWCDVLCVTQTARAPRWITWQSCVCVEWSQANHQTSSSRFVSSLSFLPFYSKMLKQFTMQSQQLSYSSSFLFPPFQKKLFSLSSFYLASKTLCTGSGGEYVWPIDAGHLWWLMVVVEQRQQQQCHRCAPRERTGNWELQLSQLPMFPTLVLNLFCDHKSIGRNSTSAAVRTSLFPSLPLLLTTTSRLTSFCQMTPELRTERAESWKNRCRIGAAICTDFLLPARLPPMW